MRTLLMVPVFVFAAIVAGTPAAGVDAAPAFPRDCPGCGLYQGPNLDLVYDPALQQVDVWPAFIARTCAFEVATREFVTLSRRACAQEKAYRLRSRVRGRVGQAETTPVAGAGQNRHVRR
jgi:hypothetical protein